MGDALMLQGRIEPAADAYRSAWNTDKRILDRNTRLTAIFEDPLPGCLPRHGKDDQILKAFTAQFERRDHDDPAYAWLLLRQVMGGAAVRLQAYRRRSAALAEASDRGILVACRSLADALPQDAHAALFHAAATILAFPGQDRRIRSAWTRAAELRERERERGGAVAPSQVFEEIRWRAKKASEEWRVMRERFNAAPGGR
jgi:hypothetical protein